MVRLLLVLLAMMPSLANAELSARFERETIRVNESVRLILETDVLFRGEPDISALEKHFTVVNQATSQNISIVNGQQSMVQRYIIELLPIEIGSFTIGPLVVGKESTKPMRITVLPAQKSASGSAEVFIESEVDADTVYVQQQVLLTVRLFLATRLLDGSLADPEPDATRVERVGDDKRYQARRSGKEFSVYERQYALFPQKSGPLEIPAVRFQGVADDNRGGNQVFGSMFNQGRRVRANGAVIDLTVNPPPASFSGKTWLPAKAVQLDELGDPVARAEVGQPVTRKIQLQASGLTAAQLPDIVFGESDGARFYPDKAVRDTVPADGGLVGILQSSVAVVGSKEGETLLPPIRVPWWNVVEDREEIAELPARELLFAASSVAQPGLDQSLLPATGDNREPAQSPAQVDVSPTAADANNARGWRGLAIASLALWVVTGIALVILWRRQRPIPVDPAVAERSRSIASWHGQVRDACRSNDAQAARRALTGWATAVYGRQSTMSTLARRIDDSALSTQIEALDRSLYSAGENDGIWEGRELWRAFEDYQPILPQDTDRKTPLPALYPGPNTVAEARPG